MNNYDKGKFLFKHVSQKHSRLEKRSKAPVNSNQGLKA